MCSFSSICSFRAVLLVFIFLLIPNRLESNLQGEHHQLCRKFEWVGNPSVTQLSTSDQFATCVNIKLYPVSNSHRLFVTLSITNSRVCADYRIEVFVLTLVTQYRSKGTSKYSSVPVGIWSRISPNVTKSELPYRFPSAYLENNDHLSTLDCSVKEEDEAFDLIFDYNTGSTANCLVQRGRIAPGDGIAAQVSVFMEADEFLPFQLTAEFLITWDKMFRYWTYDGSSHEMIYNPFAGTVEHSPQPTGRRFMLEDQQDQISELQLRKPRPTTIPRNTHMCACNDPTRSPGGVSNDPTVTIPVLNDPVSPSSLSGCFDLEIVHCPNSHTSEYLGAQFIQKPCPASPDVRTLDVSFVAIGEDGYSYGKLEVNKLVRPCFTSAAGVVTYRPVIHDLNPVYYSCKSFPGSTTSTGSEWLSVDANFEVAAGETPRVIQVILANRIKSGSAFPNELQIVAEFGVELTPGGTPEIHRVVSKRAILAFSGNTINFPKIKFQPPANPDPAYLEETPPLSCGTPTGCTGCVTLDPSIFLCRKLEVENSGSPTADDAIEPCIKSVFNFDKKDFYVSFEMDTANAACKSMKIVQSVFMVAGRDETGKVEVIGSFAMPTSADFVSGKCKDASSTATAMFNFRIAVESCKVSAVDKQLFQNYNDVGNKMVCSKWSYSSPKTKIREIQAGIKIYYNDGADKTHVHRIPVMYEALTTKIEKIAQGPNSRIDILWSSPPPTHASEPALDIPKERNTHMCACNDPTRSTGGVPNDPTLVLPVIGAASSLNGCFELTLLECPNSLAYETLGALFVQKPCTAFPDIKTVDVSFVAINEDGYSYGKLAVNILIRACFSTPAGVLTYRPVIHDQNPVSYGCKSYPGSTTSTGSEWLSVDANFKVAAGETPRVIQVMLKNPITAVKPHPKELQIVAEFGVELTPGGIKEIHRVVSKRAILAFKSPPALDWSKITFQPPIALNPGYLEESAPLTCGSPTACTGCVTPDPSIFLCRKLEVENSGSPTVSDAIEPCVKSVFNFDKTDFYISFEMDTANAACKSMKILQSVFMVTGRDESAKIEVIGSFTIPASAEFVVGKCKDASSTATAMVNLKLAVDSCNVGRGDNQLYHNYKDIGNQMVCGKWSYTSYKTNVREIQAGIKIYYNDGADKTHIHRIPVMYEAIVKKIEKIVQGPNTRVDVLWNSPPPTIASEPALDVPRERISYMCDCRQPRRSKSPPFTPAHGVIQDPVPTGVAPCFEFDLANCPDSHTKELLGAVFVLKSVTAGCPKGVKLVDLSVIAINENGYPYGRFEVNEKIKECFDKGNKLKDIFVTKPVLHDMNPIEYECSDYAALNPDTLYALPQWISIDANVESEDSPFTGYVGTVFQFMLKEPVKTSSGTLTPPQALQFIAEFGVERGGSYEIYRLRTEQKKLAFTATDQVDFSKSTDVSGDITLDINYIAEATIKCIAPKPSPPPVSGTVKDFICECADKCKAGSSCFTAPNEPDFDECFEVYFNLQASSSPPKMFMGLRKEASTKCPDPTIVIHDVFFTALKRPVGGRDSQVVGEWSLLDDAEYPQYTTAGGCIDTAVPDLEPQRSSRFSVKDCQTVATGGSKHAKGVFWHYRNLEKPEEIMCAKFSFTPVKGAAEVQAGFKVLYSSGGGPVRQFTGMHPKIYQQDGTNPLVLVYDKKNVRVILQTFLDFKRKCFSTPVKQESQMCTCLNPQRPSGVTLPLPIVELDSLTTGIENCFELKMADCQNTHTAETLGVVFIQKGEACGKPDLKTIDMSIIAINDWGYPYGELEATLTSSECLDTTTPTGVLAHRPVVNQLHPISYQCDKIYMPARSKYSSGPATWLTLNLGVISDFKGPTPPPHVLQVILKNQVQTAGDHPETLQFIAEFTVQETLGGPVTAYRIASEHRKLGFTTTTVDFGKSPIETAVPRIVLHPDYTDLETPKPCDNSLSKKPAPSIKYRDWHFCACFQWETTRPTNNHKANAAEIQEIMECTTITFTHDSSISTTPTFFFSIAKVSPTGKVCTDFNVIQFALTMLGRDENGKVKVLAKEGKWARADLIKDYVVGKCYPTGAGTTWQPQKTGTTSIRGCSHDPPPPKATPATYFYYRYLRKDGDVNCAIWELNSPPPFTFQEIQVVVKIQAVLTSRPGVFFTHHIWYPLMFEIRKGTTGVDVNPISKVDVPNDRQDLLHMSNPVKNTKNCFPTPFVPTSDICDCTEYRHKGFNQIPDQTLTEDLVDASPAIDPDCFDFQMTPCTIAGDIYDTIGVTFIIKTPKSTPACTADIDIEDIAFVALGHTGFPFGTLSFREFHRVCIQPADLSQYTIKNLDFARPVGGLCDTRKRPDGTSYDAEFEYGKQIPNWIQVAVDVDVTALEKEVVVQIYLEKPPPRTSAKQIQFIAELLVKQHSTTTRHIFKVKSKVYDIGYTSAGEYDPSALAENTVLKEIDRNDIWYETDDTNKKCHIPRPPSFAKKPFDIQQCACFEFTDPPKPIGTMLDATISPLYSGNIEACIFYEWTTNTDTSSTMPLYFYFTVWSKTTAEDPKCGEFEVIAMTLTPLMRNKTGAELKGWPYVGREWARVTLPAPGFTVTSTDENLQRGLYCAVPTTYKGKLRRLHPSAEEYTVVCTKVNLYKNQFFYTYPLMNQDDEGNAFCAALHLADMGSPADPDKNPDRFEFQIIGYLFMDFPLAGMKYYAIKRSPVFEFFRNIPPTGGPPVSPAVEITFPGNVFAVQEPIQDPKECSVDVCLYP